MLDFLRRKDKRRPHDATAAAAAAAAASAINATQAASAATATRRQPDPQPVLRDRNLPSAARRQPTQHRAPPRQKVPDKENGTFLSKEPVLQPEMVDTHRRWGKRQQPVPVGAQSAHPAQEKKRKGLRKKNKHEPVVLAKSVTSDRRRSIKVAAPVVVPLSQPSSVAPKKRVSKSGPDKDNVLGGENERRNASRVSGGENRPGHQRKPSNGGSQSVWPHIELADILRSNDIARADTAIRKIGAAAEKDNITKLKMVREGVANSVIALLRHEDATLEMRRDSTYAIAELAVLEACEDALVSAGAVPVLVRLIEMAQHSDRATLGSACRGLRNLLGGKESTAVQAAKNGCVEPLLAIINGRTARYDETGIVVEAAAAISNFSQHGTRFQNYVARHGGVVALTTLGMRSEDEEAMFHVNNVLAEFAREARLHKSIVAADGLATAFRALRIARDLEVVAESSRLIGNIGMTQKGRAAVREAGGIGALIDRLDLCKSFKDVVPAYDIIRALANVCIDSRAASEALKDRSAAIALLRAYTTEDAPELLVKNASRALQRLAQGSEMRRTKVLYYVGVQLKQAVAEGLPVKRLYELRIAIFKEVQTAEGETSPQVPESLERLSRASIRLINSGVVNHSRPSQLARKAQVEKASRPIHGTKPHGDRSELPSSSKLLRANGQTRPDVQLHRTNNDHLTRGSPHGVNEFKSTGRILSVTRKCKPKQSATGMQQLVENRMVGDDEEFEGLPRGNEEGVVSDADLRARMLAFEANGNMVQDFFEIGQVLGKGGYGSVFMAKDIRTGDIVAIKRFHNSGALVDKKAVKEQNIWKGLHHPNVVEFKGSFVGDNGSLNLVVEYVDGLSLAEHLSQYSAFPETLVAEIARQVLNGLEYLHKNGVTHRDLKPANILVDSSAAVKICDFGVSRSESVQTINPGQQHMVGTPWYIAPEMVEYRPYTTSVDIWSLGCTALELATGRRPYHELSAMQVLFRMVEDRRPPIPSHLSVELQDFLQACWIWDPQERPSATELLRHPFVLKARKLSDSSRQSSVGSSGG